MAHGRHTPEFGGHLRHHGAQVGLLALQFPKGIAHMDALDGRGVQSGVVQHALRGFLHHVRDVLTLAGPGLGKVGLVTAQNVNGCAHWKLLWG